MSAFFLGLVAALATTAADRAAIFNAAGFAPSAGKYLMCDRRTPLGLETRDFNGDKQLDALVIDGGLECYGSTESGFVLLTRSGSGSGKWTRLYGGSGVPRFLSTRANGWPDLEVGGPGFCFPILRWTGKEYANHRREYQGKPCRR
ncbi:MAG: hypothetical protein V4696_02950 [Pseudomonadota bacterium]